MEGRRKWLRYDKAALDRFNEGLKIFSNVDALIEDRERELAFAARQHAAKVRAAKKRGDDK